jgi:hypothetical protein
LSEKSERCRKNTSADGKIGESGGWVDGSFGMGWPKVSGFYANSMPARSNFRPLERSEYIFSKKTAPRASNAENGIFSKKNYALKKI